MLRRHIFFPIPNKTRLQNGFPRFACCLFVVLPIVFGASCAKDIEIDDIGDEVSTSPSESPNRTNEHRWLQDVISLGDTGIGNTGIDILVVVDNDPVMASARMRMSTALYALLTELLHPLKGAPQLSSIRLAMTSSNMGLQYGRQFGAPEQPDDGNGTDEPYAYGCDGFGDNGAFLPLFGMLAEVAIENYQIRCEDYGGQCPKGWRCQSGTCVAPEEGSPIPCPAVSGETRFLQSTAGGPDPDLAAKAACMLHGPTSKCVVRQPLEAAVKALSMNPSFLVRNHLLMIIVLSGRDDCSIEDAAIFTPDNWPLENTRISCFTNDSDIHYLYDVNDYYEKFLAFKDGNPAAVLYAAVVGAPEVDCNGTGVDAASKRCITSPKMKKAWKEYHSDEESTYYEAAAACQFNYSDPLEDSPKPGRRLVELAMKFGNAGYVQSMCSAHWDNMVNHLVISAHQRLSAGECRLDTQLKVRRVPDDTDCLDCVIPQCTLFAKFIRTGDEIADTSCPASFVYGKNYKEDSGHVTYQDHTVVICPIKNLPAPVDCGEAQRVVEQNQVGWYYCQSHADDEDSEAACGDGIDNNRDGFIDCEQPACEYCYVCGNASGCSLGCKENVFLTPEAEEITGGQNLFLQCVSDII